ncbi:MAG: hypothetical protein LKM37_08990 [Bacteroidales bacterium]|jgi:hypothetical protein|nr:hypothetical protein [Bacteroidales bacterium]MCI1733525.1 hypothetical protein [Bacteroidales bacterium]
MKKILTLCTCIAGVILLASCGKSGEKKYLTVSPATVTVSSAATDISINVSANVSYVSSVVEGGSWITKTTSTSSTSTTEVFHIAAGLTEGSRTGKIVYVGAGINDTVKITQSQKDLIQLSGSTALDYIGGTYTVTLMSNVDYDLSILNTPSWLRFSDSKAVTTTKKSLVIDKNLSGADRTAYIICKDKNSTLADTLDIMQETVPFLKQSLAGVYSSNTAVASIQYTQFSDQYAETISGSVYSFRLQNVFNDTFCCFDGIPLDLSNAATFDLTVTQNYLTTGNTSTYSVQVLKNENGNVWLYNDANNIGFIIKK